ncbi:citramalate synthase [Desulfosarcina sp. OttesenSCG-928-A07]|nr:citramalate synthase [Desulfosarcina sp. OttesenSCG-928-G17]MDL2328655.1 citramalate synthase [Desulfosarcina sp. OttesenSCG-928-A07]
MDPIFVYDTTLRDGTQGENVTFTADEKLKIAKRLDDMGIAYIEGGWPGSNPKDMRFFELARKERFKTARITAFGATRRPGISAAEDVNLAAILDSGVSTAAIFGKSWSLHVTGIMGLPLSENLSMIHDSVAFLKANGKEVVYDAEHFFDGFKEDPDYAVQTLKAAFDAGADFLVLCDTNGGTLPHEMQILIPSIRDIMEAHAAGKRPLKLGIHSHNDCGMAEANAITAVNCGAVMVQGTINGYGERCGNADLTTVIPVLCEKMHRPCIPAEKLRCLKNLSRFVSETANIVPLNVRPFVGRSAFSHKGGIHVSAVMKEPRAYEHMDPEKVGNRRRVLMSDMAGKSNVEYKAREMGVDLCAGGCDSKTIVSRIKRMEEEGYQFDVADGSFKILLEKFTDQFTSLFDLDSFRVTIEKDGDTPCSAHATIKISVGGTHEITAAEGMGPVSALDNALRKALGNFYPDLDSMHLVDFKVRVVDGREGTAAKVRVFIESRDSDEVWTTVGVSEDIIEASWQALTDSFQFKLAKEAAKKAQAAIAAGVSYNPPEGVACRV